MVANKNRGNHAAMIGENVDLATKTPRTLSKKTNKNPKVTPNAKLNPVPPLRFLEATATAINVKTKTDNGMLHRL